ncbi:MAG: metallophosphoesterase [Acidimicrobiia bacterium]
MLGKLAVAAAALPVAWGVIEARLFALEHYGLPILPGSKSSSDLTILQVSDLHLRPRSRALAKFIRSLRDSTYDVVLATGDLLGDPSAVELCAELLNSLSARHGRYFVLGSSDYYAPTFKNYLDYFTGKRRIPTKKTRTQEFRDALHKAGWEELTNRTVMRDLGGMTIQITGLDDPHLNRDDRTLLVRDAAADFALCVVHDPSPYLEASRAGFDLIVSGHTHGGQVRLPLIGALVTNSDLPRRYARGLSVIEKSTLFVNPGLGTGKFAPFRFLCRPEASVLHLTQKT